MCFHCMWGKGLGKLQKITIDLRPNMLEPMYWKILTFLSCRTLRRGMDKTLLYPLLQEEYIRPDRYTALKIA